MFRIKICGITCREDAALAIKAGADAIGLNFFSGSPRCVTVEKARDIAASLQGRARAVGVFVNAPAAEIRKTAQEVGLDLVQLHGDEQPADLQSLSGLAVMRAFRVGTDLGPVATYLDQCHQRRCVPRMVLLDALQAGQYGGTGARLDWEAVRRDRSKLRGEPLVLAGGLTPDNVAAAIAAVRPWGVDVASGVEASPGKKSPAAVEAFVAAAQQAFREQW